MSTIKSKIDRQNKEQYSYQKMLSYGWTPTQASAIVGNLKHESGFRTDVEGDKGYKGGSSFGIAQFRGARLVSLKNTYGNNWKDLDNQLEFVNEELKTTHKKAGDRLRKATTIYDAGRIVSDDYEIPALKWNANDSRQSAVFDTYRKYSGLKLTQQEEIELLQGTTERMMSNYNQTQKPKTNTPTTPIPEISNLQSVPELSNLADDKEQEEEESQNARAVLQQKKNEQNFISELIKSSQIQYIDPNQVEDYTQEQPQEEFRNGGEKNSLWKNIRNNRGSGKAPTKEMLEQEVKIKKHESGGIIKDDMGYWNPENWGKPVEINSNLISMEGVSQTLLGISNQTGERKILKPGKNYRFKNTQQVTEYPI